MKKQRGTAGLKKILTVLLCAALVFGLAACGGKKNPGGTTKTPAYQAKFDPYYLHPGLAEGSDWTTADVWYPVDSPDSLPMYLTYGYDKGYDDCQFVITWIDEEGYDYADCLTVVDGMELVSMDGEELDVDFVFPDSLTAYDKESKTLYSRANYLDYDQLAEAFSGKTFANGRGNASFTFNDDRSAVQTYGGQEYEGTWEITADTVLSFFDRNDASYDNHLQILHDREGIYLYADSDYYYPQEPEEPENDGDADEAGSEDETGSGETDEKGEEAAA